MVLTSPNCAAKRSQAAGREFHEVALRLEGKIILGRRVTLAASASCCIWSMVRRSARGKRFARYGIVARVGNRCQSAEIIRRLSNPVSNPAFLFARGRRCCPPCRCPRRALTGQIPQRAINLFQLVILRRVITPPSVIIKPSRPSIRWPECRQSQKTSFA